MEFDIFDVQQQFRDVPSSAWNVERTQNMSSLRRAHGGPEWQQEAHERLDMQMSHDRAPLHTSCWASSPPYCSTRASIAATAAAAAMSPASATSAPSDGGDAAADAPLSSGDAGGAERSVTGTASEPAAALVVVTPASCSPAAAAC